MKEKQKIIDNVKKTKNSEVAHSYETQKFGSKT